MLTDLGWSSELAESFLPYATSSTPGRIARVDRGAYDVLTADGPVRAVASLPVARAAAADQTLAPTVGDWAAVDASGDDPAVLQALLPRRTTVLRGAGRRHTTAQVLATNVDVLLLVTAAVPRAPLNRVERFLTLAWDSGARPVVVLTKTDLADDVPAQLRRIASAAPGADVVAASPITRDGVDDVAAQLGTGVTGALLGASGAGKTTLANALLDGGDLVTSRLRADGKGRHTTAWRELVVLPAGGVLLDTPGLRGVQLWDSAEGLEQTFSDVAQLAVDCRFRDCRHASEPGCAVLAAVAAGVLEERRVASYAKLLREQAWLAGRQDALARIEERRQWKIRHKEMRRGGRDGSGPRP